MRSIVLLTLACIPTIRLVAQYYGISFDSGGLPLDSVYPLNTWQVGEPQKMLFDSAYSAPNALVTDTMLPYPVGGLAYAEFHLPVWFTGSAFLTFTHKLDIETDEALGWVEFRSPWDTIWTRMMDNGGIWGGGDVDYAGFAGELTDSGMVFNTPIHEWSTSTFYLYCIAVFGENGQRGGGLDTTMRFRFVFDGLANSGGHDGWLIDNIWMEHQGPCNGIEELEKPLLEASPNPVDRELQIKPALPWGASYRIEIISSTGAIVLRDGWRNSGMRTIDLSHLSNGPYLLRAISDSRQSAVQIIVQH